MPDSLFSLYPELRFTKEQILIDQDEALLVAQDFFNTPFVPATALTDVDRAYVQACLLIAVDRSNKSGIFFDVYSAFMTAGPSGSVAAVARNLARRAARRWFDNIIGDNPRVSVAGKAAIRNSQLMTDWVLRWKVPDPTYIDNLIVQ